MPSDYCLKAWIGRVAQRSEETQRQPSVKIPKRIVCLPNSMIVDPARSNDIDFAGAVNPVNCGGLDAVAPEPPIDSRNQARIVHVCGRLSQRKQRCAVAVNKDKPLSMFPHHKSRNGN